MPENNNESLIEMIEKQLREKAYQRSRDNMQSDGEEEEFFILKSRLAKVLAAMVAID
jgi:hypothetical protein